MRSIHVSTSNWKVILNLTHQRKSVSHEVFSFRVGSNLAFRSFGKTNNWNHTSGNKILSIRKIFVIALCAIIHNLPKFSIYSRCRQFIAIFWNFEFIHQRIGYALRHTCRIDQISQRLRNGWAFFRLFQFWKVLMIIFCHSFTADRLWGFILFFEKCIFQVISNCHRL